MSVNDKFPAHSCKTDIPPEKSAEGKSQQSIPEMIRIVTLNQSIMPVSRQQNLLIVSSSSDQKVNGKKPNENNFVKRDLEPMSRKPDTSCIPYFVFSNSTH